MLKNQQYYDALDGLRTICIIFTVIDHTAGNPGINGTVGVDVFFALSGYLITTLLLRERDKTGQVCLPCFYIRRFFRIVPLSLGDHVIFPGCAAVLQTHRQHERACGFQLCAAVAFDAQ